MTEPVRTKKHAGFWWLLLIPAVLAVALLYRGAWLFFGLRSYKLSSASMEKTIYAGDTVLAENYISLRRRPARGELVIFTHGEYTLVKRLIGLPGDQVEVKNRQVLVNGVALIEPYINLEGESLPELDDFGPAVVKPDEVFLLGDNRNHSLDSRMEQFGAVHLEDIFSKPVMVTVSRHHPLAMLH